jgi:HlyD family secretion protein
MTATVHIEAARDDNALTVPTAAVRFRPDADVFKALGEEIPSRAGQAGRTGQAGQAGRSGRSGQTGQPGSHALLWRVVDGKLQPVRVTLGISDGTNIAVTSGELQQGTSVAIGVRSDGGQTASAQTSSPLVPSMNLRRAAGAAR